MDNTTGLLDISKQLKLTHYHRFSKEYTRFTELVAALNQRRDIDHIYYALNKQIETFLST